MNKIGQEAEFCFMDSYFEFKDGFRLEIKKASFTLRSKIFEPLQITRIKATRCETLRTVTTNNSKKHSHLTYCGLPQCIIDGPKVNGNNFFHF